MAYGYTHWLKAEGTDASGQPISPAVGALRKVLEVVENMEFPRPGWGMIDPSELSVRLQKLRGPDNHPDWEQALTQVETGLAAAGAARYCGEKIESKVVTILVKNLIKGLTGGPAEPEKEAEPESSETDAS